MNLQAARRLLLMLGALEWRAVKRAGRKMAAMGNDPRLAAMLVNAGEGDSAATAAMLAAILRIHARRRYGFKRSIFAATAGW